MKKWRMYVLDIRYDEIDVIDTDSLDGVQLNWYEKCVGVEQLEFD